MKKLIMFVMVIAIAVPVFSGIASAQNVPVCITVCPPGIIADETITLTAIDEFGDKVDLSEFDVVGIAFENIGVSFDVGDGDIYDSLFTEDGRVQFTMTQAMLDADRWHVGGGGPFDWHQHIAAPQALVDTCSDCGGPENNWPPEHRLVTEAIAAGGTCGGLAGCDAPPNPFIIDPNVMLVYETGETEGDFGVSLKTEPPPGATITITVDPNAGGPSEDITLIGGSGDTGSIIFDVNDSNWDEPYIICFKAIDDDIAEPQEIGDTLLEPQNILISSIWPGHETDANFVGERAVIAKVKDNDQPDILFTLTRAEQHNPKNPLLPGTPAQVWEQTRWFVVPLKQWREIGVTLQVEPLNDDPCKVGYVRVIVANEGESGNQPIMWLNPEWDYNEPLPPIDEPNAIVFTSDGTAVSGVIGVVSKWDESYPILIFGNDDDVLQVLGEEGEYPSTEGNENYGASLLFSVESTSDERYAPLNNDNEPEGLERSVIINIEDNECGAWGISYLDIGNPNAATDPNYQDDDGNPLPDCYVNIYDVIEFATKWLDCSDPQTEGCESYL